MITSLVPKILIIESQMIIATEVSLQFLKLGYDVIGINTCSADAFKTIAEQRPDIVLMSLQLQDSVSGIQTARTILKDLQVPVVFLSANTDLGAFKSMMGMQAYAYIPKPFETKDLQRGIETALDRMIREGLWRKKKQVSTPEKGLFILQKGRFLKIAIHDILFVEANRNYCHLSTQKRQYRLTVPLRKIEDQLPGNQFIRVHRSFLINLHKINTLQEHGKHLTIQNHQIPISRRLRPEVLKCIKGI